MMNMRMQMDLMPQQVKCRIESRGGEARQWGGLMTRRWWWCSRTGKATKPWYNVI